MPLQKPAQGIKKEREKLLVSTLSWLFFMIVSLHKTYHIYIQERVLQIPNGNGATINLRL